MKIFASMKNNTSGYYGSRLNHGMTLVETLVVLGILVIIMSALWAFGTSIFTNSGAISGSLETAYGAQVLLKSIVKEMRGVTSAVTGAYPLAETSTSSIVFYSDLDADGIAERISYYLTPGSGTIVGTLYRSVVRASGSPVSYDITQAKITTLATNVRNSSSSLLFEYFDETYDGIGVALSYPISIADIRLVKISLELDVDSRRSPLPISYSTQVSLRNLKDNL
jgi:prepilin-type N-terminal cleavage/methylation domain-containing protein